MREFAAIVVIGVVLAAGLYWLVSANSSSPEPSAAPSIAASVCPADGTAATPLDANAAPYSGPAPHPARLLRVADGRPSAESGLPAEWTTPNDAAVQLAVCEHVTVGREADECAYSDGSRVPVLDATYRYRVYAARTGKAVTEFTLPGVGWHCAPVTSSAGPPGAVVKLPSAKALADALRPTVTG
jgi:hypothetical protein